MPISVNCSSCAKPLSLDSSRIRKSKHGNHFCNVQCRADWQVGRYRVPNSGKYRIVKRRGTGKSVQEHRLKLERELGRTLGRSEHVHHKNQIKSDNADGNLQLISPKDHNILHKSLTLDISAIISLREEGLTVSEIALRFGVSRKPINRRLTERGIDASTKHPRWDLTKAIELLNSGYNRAQIAKAFNVAESSLRKVLRHRGIVCSDSRIKYEYDIPRIIELRKRGNSIRAIADILGVKNTGKFWKIVTSAMKTIQADSMPNQSP